MADIESSSNAAAADAAAAASTPQPAWTTLGKQGDDAASGASSGISAGNSSSAAPPHAAPFPPDSAMSQGCASSSFYDTITTPPIQKTLKRVNVSCYVISAVIALGIVLLDATPSGVYADPYLWMKYQTLITPANYVNIIYVVFFLTQGLYIYASVFHPKYSCSALVGYKHVTTLKEAAKESPAAHYPFVCAVLLLTVVCYDSGWTKSAFVSSLLSVAVSVRVVSMQSRIAAEMDRVLGGGSEPGENDSNASELRTPVEDGDDDPAHPYSISHVKQNALLAFPFEVFGGYSLALTFLYFNVALEQVWGPPRVLLGTADFCLVAILAVGVLVLWKTQRHYYGVSLSLIWYLVGVALELRDPSQPIDNEFSDVQIAATQAVAGLSATVLTAVFSLRIVKTIIKNKQNCSPMPCGSLQATASGEDLVTTDYVQA